RMTRPPPTSTHFPYTTLFRSPTPEERRTCGHWLDRELELAAPTARCLLALGAIGWDAALAAVRRLGWTVPRPKPRFGHGAESHLDRKSTRLNSSHVKISYAVF